MNDRSAALFLARYHKAVREMRKAQASYARRPNGHDLAVLRAAEPFVDELGKIVDEDPPVADAQRTFADLLTPPEPPPVPAPPPPSEHLRRSATAARREAARRAKKIEAGYLAEGHDEITARARAEDFRRRYLARCGQ